MGVNQALNAYKKTEVQADVHPVKLIHAMYERVLLLLEQAAQAIHAKNPKARGENLGKAIAVISELNAAVKSEDNSETARFLRGLYTSILLELPKVSIGGDMRIIERTSRYIKRLKDIWEETAMKEHGFQCHKEKGGVLARGDKEVNVVPQSSFSFEKKEIPPKGVSISI